MDPPPRDPTTRAKGSRLLRPVRRAFLQPCGRGRGPKQCGARNRTMTVKRDLKSIIRERQQKTGESYTAARSHVMRERAKLLGLGDDSQREIAKPMLVEAA